MSKTKKKKKKKTENALQLASSSKYDSPQRLAPRGRHGAERGPQPIHLALGAGQGVARAGAPRARVPHLVRGLVITTSSRGVSE